MNKYLKKITNSYRIYRNNIFKIKMTKTNIDEMINTLSNLNIKENNNNIQITPSNIQTKKWRKEQEWYSNGKHNECEIFQRNLIQKITNKDVLKTHLRFHTISNNLVEKKYPNRESDGYEYTEDLDGYQLFEGLNDNIKYQIYYNLKMICDAGGAQTRSLREIYTFIRCQLEYLLINQNQNQIQNLNTYFINILDGDEAYKNRDKFNYLYNKTEYNQIKEYVFIGDLKEFETWYKDKYT